MGCSATRRPPLSRSTSGEDNFRVWACLHQVCLRQKISPSIFAERTSFGHTVGYSDAQPFRTKNSALLETEVRSLPAGATPWKWIFRPPEYDLEQCTSDLVNAAPASLNG